jgi:hypothetical protein
MGTKTCNKCQKKELGWDYNYNKKTGKWKLEDHRRQDGKWCNKLSAVSQETKMKKGDITKCKLCKGNSGWLTTEQGIERHPSWVYITQEEHSRMYHPNNEPKDDIDMMVIFDEEKIALRNKRISQRFI